MKKYLIPTLLIASAIAEPVTVTILTTSKKDFKHSKKIEVNTNHFDTDYVTTASCTSKCSCTFQLSESRPITCANHVANTPDQLCHVALNPLELFPHADAKMMTKSCYINDGSSEFPERGMALKRLPRPDHDHGKPQEITFHFESLVQCSRKTCDCELGLVGTNHRQPCGGSLPPVKGKGYRDCKVKIDQDEKDPLNIKCALADGYFELYGHGFAGSIGSLDSRRDSIESKSTGISFVDKPDPRDRPKRLY